MQKYMILLTAAAILTVINLKAFPNDNYINLPIISSSTALGNVT